MLTTSKSVVWSIRYLCIYFVCKFDWGERHGRAFLSWYIFMFLWHAFPISPEVYRRHLSEGKLTYKAFDIALISIYSSECIKIQIHNCCDRTSVPMRMREFRFDLFLKLFFSTFSHSISAKSIDQLIYATMLIKIQTNLCDNESRNCKQIKLIAIDWVCIL